MSVAALRSLLGDPYFFPAEYDFKADSFIFAEATPEVFHRSLRLVASDFSIESLAAIPRKDVLRAEGPSSANSINYVFHLPFSGSTLLTRYLERDAFVIRDPVVLQTVFCSEQRKLRSKQSLGRLEAKTLSLLGRRPGSIPVVLRTAGYFPQIIELLVQSSTYRSSIFVFVPPLEFLQQVLKSKERRTQSLILLKQHSELIRTKFGRHTSSLSEPRAAALYWAFAVGQIAHLIERGLKVRTINCQDFLQDPLPALEKIYLQFGIDAKPKERHFAGISGRHAKFGYAFNAKKRTRELAEVARMLASDLSEGMAYLEKIDPGQSLLKTLNSGTCQ